MNNQQNRNTLKIAAVSSVLCWLGTGCIIDNQDDGRYNGSATSRNPTKLVGDGPYSAMKFRDTGLRNQVLTNIATNAAATGDVDVAKQALSAIANLAARDSAAESCALALAKVGMNAAANDVAGTINDPATRKIVLSKLTLQ